MKEEHEKICMETSDKKGTALKGESTNKKTAGTHIDKPAGPKKKPAKKNSRLNTKRMLEKECEELKNRLLRLQADFENFRKRTLREKNEIYTRANEDIISEMLPVMDHLELALSSVDPDNPGNSFHEGVRLVSEQMSSVLGKFGLQPIETEEQDFDPNFHEAISYVPSAEVPANKIISQIRKGYTLGGKLLRAARVTISSGESEKQPVNQE